MSETRKLAAILVADVVGYSRLAGADEDRTLSRLRGLRSNLIDPAIAAHHGRIVKRTGDGSIIEFRSVVDAVRCAIEATLGAKKSSNASMLDRQRPLAREAVCAAYAQVGRTAAIKASPFAQRVYMKGINRRGWLRSQIAIGWIATPHPGVCHGRDRESQQARHNPRSMHKLSQGKLRENGGTTWIRRKELETRRETTLIHAPENPAWASRCSRRRS